MLKCSSGNFVAVAVTVTCRHYNSEISNAELFHYYSGDKSMLPLHATTSCRHCNKVVATAF